MSGIPITAGNSRLKETKLAMPSPMQFPARSRRHSRSPRSRHNVTECGMAVETPGCVDRRTKYP
jgi:hypothetical protein